MSKPKPLTDAEVVLVKDLGALVCLNVPIQPTPGVRRAIELAYRAGFVTTGDQAQRLIQQYLRKFRSTYGSDWKPGNHGCVFNRDTGKCICGNTRR